MSTFNAVYGDSVPLCDRKIVVPVRDVQKLRHAVWHTVASDCEPPTPTHDSESHSVPLGF